MSVNKILTMAILFLFVGTAIAQTDGLIEGTAKEFTTCPGATQTYYFKGSSSSSCNIRWTVSNGVFPDYQNSTSHDDQTQTGSIVSIKVKWNITGTTGTISVQNSGCSLSGTAVTNKTFTHKIVPATLTATPSTISAGATVSLGVTYNNNPYSITGVNWTNTGGFGKSGNPVTDNPSATTTYYADIKYDVTEGTTTRNCVIKKDIVVTVGSGGTTPPTPPTTPPSGANGIPAADPSQIITNNVMCCSQCLTPSQTPTGLAHDTSVPAMSGGTTPYTYKWYKSFDGITWTVMSNITATIFPPKTTQTMWYVRTVNTVPGNIIRVSVANTDLTVGAHTNLLGNTVEAANTITIQGDQLPTTGSKFFFNAGSSITVLPNTTLSPNTYLQIGQPCISTANGRIASSGEPQKEILFAESDSLLNVTTKVDTDNSLYHISPNPSKGEAKFVYKTLQSGTVKLIVLDNTGKKLTTLVDTFMPEGSHEVGLDTREWKSGLYLLKLSTSTYRATLKLIVDQ